MTEQEDKMLPEAEGNETFAHLDKPDSAKSEADQEQASENGNAYDTAAALKAVKTIGERPARSEPFEHIWDNANQILVMLIAAVTLFSTILAFLQSDSGSRASENSRNAQTRALLMLQKQVGGLMDTDYEVSLYQAWNEINSLGGMDYRLASEAEEAAEAEQYQESAERYASASSEITQLSSMFHAPYQKESGSAPDLNSYWIDTVTIPQEKVAEERAAYSEISRAWNNKSNAYQMMITLISVTLFLYGLGLTLERWLKGLFTLMGTITLTGIAVWAFVTIIRPVPVYSQEAIDSYIDGFRQLILTSNYEYWSVYQAVPDMADKAIASFDKAIELRPTYAKAYSYKGDACATAAEALMISKGEAARREQITRLAISSYEKANQLKPDDYHTLWNLGWSLYMLGDYERSITYFQKGIELAPQAQLGMRLDIAANLLGMGKKEEGLKQVEEAIKMAADHPTSSDAYYFRQLIRVIPLLKKVRPHDGMDEMVLMVKEASTSLRYRRTVKTGETNAVIGKLSFSLPANADNGEDAQSAAMTSFPAGTDKIQIFFDYSGMKDGELVVMKVYFNGTETPNLNQVIHWKEGQEGTSSSFFVRGLVEHTLAGLNSGDYVVEFYVEGNLKTNGGFTIER